MEPASDGRRARYADRFRDLAPQADQVELGAPEPDEPPREWPGWLSRAAWPIGLAAAAVVALTVGDQTRSPVDPVDPSPTTSSATPRAARTPPAEAQLDVVAIEAQPWESRGFTYHLTLDNPTDQPFHLLDVGPEMSGTELEWNRDLVLAPGSAGRLRVDYLVINCLAATTSAVPVELRIVVRHGETDDSIVELATIPMAEVAAHIEAQGNHICAQDGSPGQPLDPAG